MNRLLASAPILAFPDFAKPFILYKDASATGLGAMLSQIGDEWQGACHSIWESLSEQTGETVLHDTEGAIGCSGVFAALPFLPFGRFLPIKD